MDTTTYPHQSRIRYYDSVCHCPPSQTTADSSAHLLFCLNHNFIQCSHIVRFIISMNAKIGQTGWQSDSYHCYYYILCLRLINPISSSKQMILFQSKRISAQDALSHQYLDEGRMRYHSCMCNCCQTTPATGGQRVLHRSDVALEPVSKEPFSYDFENELTSLGKAKDKLHRLVLHNINHSMPLTINPHSATYKRFTR